MQEAAYEMRISDWSSDVCSSDVIPVFCNFCRSGCCCFWTFLKILLLPMMLLLGGLELLSVLLFTIYSSIATVLRAAVSLAQFVRSEEHTSELQSLMRISYAVFCLKKKKNRSNNI